MKKSKFSETQIYNILKELEQGISVQELSRKHSITAATLYQWKNRYGGMEKQDLQRLKQLEQENSRLKRIVADQTIDISFLKEIIAKKP